MALARPAIGGSHGERMRVVKLTCATVPNASASVDVASAGMRQRRAPPSPRSPREPSPRPMRITRALVRDCLAASAHAAIPSASAPPTEPSLSDASRRDRRAARRNRSPRGALLLEALLRRIPVVTANKSLLAAHGRELREIASRDGNPTDVRSGGHRRRSVSRHVRTASTCGTTSRASWESQTAPATTS